MSMQIRGRDLISGLPKVIKITSKGSKRST